MKFYKKLSKKAKKTGKEVKAIREIEDHIDDPFALAATHINMKTERNTSQKILFPRASSILKECLRYHVIGTKFRLRKNEYIGPKARLLWGYGNAFHFWVQNTGDVFGNRRIGFWKCRACQKVTHVGGPPVDKCKDCGAHPDAFIYQEHHLLLRGKYPLSGHPDIFITVKGGLIRVVEIKTIKSDQFFELVAPLADHEQQCQTYMFACPLDSSLPFEIDPEIGYVLYISKVHMTKNLPFKMFHVKRNETIISMIKKRSREYKRGVLRYPEYLPAVFDDCNRGNFRNYKAKYCECRTECIKQAEAGR